ncbi:Asp-tRNA(Asn)/Glu-tRNA(Gln) amidotransferase A subunit family amidase [Thermonema lapsum]|uniref:Asp-tRNA(Asn)/Glu-tRNA(Gln) amidotransferase A subunit family amidase n=1 Tax=Thermonema lapsum TaxID=28195 RepID=A0A846MU35_9BACT|nr:amidase [Thermonema lapsum]NIK74747.1 Asp-tRNA(Asn)/Glu-tRNA(Gln) amidotransferase A subunit family amidase [Thermonema lapsum]
MKRFLLPVVLLTSAFVLGRLSSDITPADVQSAAKLIGLQLTPIEIDSMLDGLAEQKQSFEALRKHNIPNDLPPAFTFHPIPPTYTAPHIGPDELIFQGETFPKIQRPANDNDLAFLSIRELASLLVSRQITSEELTRFFLNRLKKYDDTLHCVITYTEALALQKARQADKELAAGHYRGLLHGIPYVAKDLLATKNYPTTWGAKPFRSQVIDYDAAVIEQLDAAGAILIAKVSLGALAWGDVWFGGRTRNPWNPATGSSGSSAGSAAAVAAGLAPFAIGTETLGSIVSPSTVCGVTGLRPTFGAVSRFGAMALSWTMDKIGPIARSAEDCAIVYRYLHNATEADPRDPFHVATTFSYRADRDWRRLRIAFVPTPASSPTYAADSTFVATLRQAGARIDTVSLPAYPDITFILWAEAAAAFDELTRSNRDDELVRQNKQAWPNYFRMARFIPAVEYIQAQRLRYRLIHAMQQLMSKYDVVIAPSFASSQLYITNMTGHPCVVLPTGFNRSGMPQSICLLGRWMGEGAILEVANAYQQLTSHHKRRPPLVGQ